MRFVSESYVQMCCVTVSTLPMYESGRLRMCSNWESCTKQSALRQHITSVEQPLYKFQMRSSYSWPRVQGQVAEPMDQSRRLGLPESFHRHSHLRRLRPSLVPISPLQELLPLVWQKL